MHKLSPTNPPVTCTSCRRRYHRNCVAEPHRVPDETAWMCPICCAGNGARYGERYLRVRWAEFKELNQYVDYIAWFVQFTQGKPSMPITSLPEPSPAHPCIILNLVRYQTHNSTVVEVTDPAAAKKLHGRVGRPLGSRKKPRLDESALDAASNPTTLNVSPAHSGHSVDSQNDRIGSTSRSSLADLLSPETAPMRTSSSVQNEAESTHTSAKLASIRIPGSTTHSKDTAPVERASRPLDISRLVDPPDGNEAAKRAPPAGARTPESRQGRSSGALRNGSEGDLSRKRPRDGEGDREEDGEMVDRTREMRRPDVDKEAVPRTRKEVEQYVTRPHSWNRQRH
ncbi:hypothetical protein BS47DRAFT_1159537 [Hydnum rufescens UP504]|uniref:Uncharacterized protein n=1 Tax=Hydnum rufescens UP504 TaxID=1448309 RepID=A0A9P6AT64_9AGAM|nr:hypothetical protein BS47DRAFT_1159537 [Hydnum rufescens UP504]